MIAMFSSCLPWAGRALGMTLLAATSIWLRVHGLVDRVLGGPVTALSQPDGYYHLRLVRDRKSTRLNSSHSDRSRMPSSA